ncbi:MAG TPA: hypothetical protein DCX52_02160, partial [Massilia sp.]|nr:hypothetical protein [Massilia sp.]
GLVQAGLGWALLPRTLVQPLIAAGVLVEIGFQNASNEVRLLVDIVWSRERPMGLGARRYVELIQQAWPAPLNRECVSGRPARRVSAG